VRKKREQEGKNGSERRKEREKGAVDSKK